MPGKPVARDEHHHDGDEIRRSNRDANVLEQQERNHDRERREKHEQEHGERPEPVLLGESQVGRQIPQAQQPLTDLFEVLLRQKRRDEGR